MPDRPDYTGGFDNDEDPADRLADLTRAVNDLLNTARPLDGGDPEDFLRGPITKYVIDTGYLTVLSRIVRDGCTYEEATDA